MWVRVMVFNATFNNISVKPCGRDVQMVYCQNVIFFLSVDKFFGFDVKRLQSK